MLKIAICDDDAILCSEIEFIILEHSAKNSLCIDIEIFNSGVKLCEFMQNENSFDLIFLDIEMSEVNGVEVGKVIREKMKNNTIQIVYISAKTSYCMELFEIRPMHFLEKPIAAEQIIKQINLANDLCSKAEYAFRYKQGHISCCEAVKNIIYFESQNRLVRMLTTSGETIFYGTLTEIEQQLSKSNFLLIHKSFLVNYAHVVEFGAKELKMSNGQLLAISQQRRKAVKDLQIKLEKELSQLC